MIKCRNKHVILKVKCFYIGFPTLVFIQILTFKYVSVKHTIYIIFDNLFMFFFVFKFNLNTFSIKIKHDTLNYDCVNLCIVYFSMCISLDYAYR